MRAAVLKTRNLRFEIRNVGIPTFNDDESLLRVEACGICGTDLKEYRKKFETWKHWRRFGWALAKKAGLHSYRQKELRLGHEICGTVEDTHKPELRNKRVVVFPEIPCGVCWACQHGIETACRNSNTIGFEHAGGFAEYVSVPNENILEVPKALDPTCATLAEPLACGLHAIEVARTKEKDNVLVLGVGPIGQLITFICSNDFASPTVACDLSAYRLKIAHEMGASSTINPRELLSEDLFPDIVFDCTGGLSSLINTLIDIVRPRGTICVEGFYQGTQGIHLRKLQMKEARIVTSQGNNLKNWQDAILRIQRHAKELQPLITHTFKLDKISEAFEAAVKNDQNKAIQVIIKP